jgi:hypothetical protein
MGPRSIGHRRDQHATDRAHRRALHLADQGRAVVAARPVEGQGVQVRSCASGLRQGGASATRDGEKDCSDDSSGAGAEERHAAQTVSRTQRESYRPRFKRERRRPPLTPGAGWRP